jgi:hypothetical protein
VQVLDRLFGQSLPKFLREYERPTARALSANTLQAIQHTAKRKMSLKSRGCGQEVSQLFHAMLDDQRLREQRERLGKRVVIAFFQIGFYRERIALLGTRTQDDQTDEGQMLDPLLSGEKAG